MHVLVACEFSGVVRDAFRKRGHDAWSLDLLPTESDDPRYHIQEDVMDVLKEQKGSLVEWDWFPALKWDLIIAHPPCTAIAVSGNRWYGKDMPKHKDRKKAVKWTMNLWNLAKECGDKVCMENPVGVLPLKPTQYIQPWEYGHGETKKTGLWLHNLDPLEPTNIVDGRDQNVWKLPPSEDRWKLRSLTFQGVADAMATQWG